MKGSKNLKNQTQTCTQRINQFFWKCQNQVQQIVLFKQKDQPITGAGKEGRLHMAKMQTQLENWTE
jgi:hypothetical protein